MHFKSIPERMADKEFGWRSASALPSKRLTLCHPERSEVPMNFKFTAERKRIKNLGGAALQRCVQSASLFVILSAAKDLCISKRTT